MNFRKVPAGRQPMKILLTALLLASTTTAVAQTTSSSSMKASSWAAPVGYDLGDTGVEQPVRWGVDTAWDWDWWPLRATNHMQECVSLGRVTLDPRVSGNNTSLSSAQQATLDKQLAWLAKSGVTDLYLLAGNTTGQNWQTSWRTAYINDIALAVSYLHSKGYTVTCISPFNEPDYSPNKAPGAAEQANVARQMRQNSTLASIDVCGPSTLSPDYGLSWWNQYGDAWQVGNTHQLSGSADNFANFYAAVQRSGKKSTGDEMHNINDALVGMNYGMSEGIWWSDFGGYTRAELGRTSNDGVRVGYFENRSTFTTAAVFRLKSQPMAEVFMGSSERQANDASYTFVSQDRLVYYDGEGPTYDFTAGTPGGTGYQNGQTNAETVVELNYGEDIPVGPIHGGTFKIVNKATGKLLTATSLTNSGGVNQQAESATRNQSWVITPLGQRDAADFAYVTIHNAKTSSNTYYLDGVKWGADNGAGICVYAGGGNECERWHLRYKGGGYYVLTNHDSGLSLEGSTNNSSANTTGVVQWARTGTDRQLWRLVPADAPVESDAPAAPVGLTATSLSGSVLLEWTANTEADLLGYMIYRYNTQADIWECIARRVAGQSFIDNTCAKEGQQRYRIRAVDQSWNLSEVSSEVASSVNSDPAPVGLWRLTDNLNDLTENRMHAVSTGVTHALVDTHNAAVLDGSDDYISLPYQVGNLSEMTVSAWVRPTSSTAWQRIFDFGRNTDNYVMLTPSNGSYLRFEICKDGVKQGLNATRRLSAGAWTLVTVTVGSGKTCIYLNGELNASTSSITFRPSDVRPLLSYVGRSMFGADPLFKGAIADFCIYNYAFSADEVKTLLYHEQLMVAVELEGKPMYKLTRKSLHEAYESATAAIREGDDQTRTDALQRLDLSIAEARLSAAAYEPLQQALQRSETLAAEHPQDDADAQSLYMAEWTSLHDDFLAGEFPDDDIAVRIIETEALTNRYLMTDAMAKASETRSVDISWLVQNADFATGTTDHWTCTTDDDNYQGQTGYGCFEVWNHAFQLTQQMYGMPSGIYQVGVQAFYRNGSKTEIATNTDALAEVFLVDKSEPLCLITRNANGRSGAGEWYEYEYGKLVPNDMEAAATAFNTLNRYRNTSTVNIVSATYDSSLGEPLRFGLRKSATVNDDWTIANSFVLRYLGGSVETGIEDTADELPTAPTAAVFDLQGRRLNIGTLLPGIYIMNGRKIWVR